MKLRNLDHFRAQVMTARLYQALLVRQHASKVNGETLLRGNYNAGEARGGPDVTPIVVNNDGPVRT